jgi:hypothetical protein
MCLALNIAVSQEGGNIIFVGTVRWDMVSKDPLLFMSCSESLQLSCEHCYACSSHKGKFSTLSIPDYNTCDTNGV